MGMTTIYDEKKAFNVTLVNCDGNKISAMKTKEKDGYEAMQLEIPKTARTKVKREFKTSNLEKDRKIDVSMFEVGETVNVRGASKAKGFQGVVKRHGFKGAPKTHGHKHDLRKPGSIGATFPEHVIKGKKMAGRMGGVKKTSQNIKIVFIDKEKNVIGLLGAVPGNPNGVVEIYKK